MTDLRNYADIIRAAIKESSKADEHYNWKVKAINKGEVRFQWGYLSDKDDPFVLRVIDDVIDDEPCVIVEVPYVSDVVILIGDMRWHDAKTLDDGIHKAIKAAVRCAQHNF